MKSRLLPGHIKVMGELQRWRNLNGVELEEVLRNVNSYVKAMTRLKQI